jgi:DNA polymerase-1
MSGKVLDHLLNEQGVNRNEVLATNVVLCHTDKPTKEAIDACSPRLQSELAEVETIIAAGSEAIATLLGKGTVASARGYVHRASGNRRVIATSNPAIVLRDDSTFPSLQRDFRLAINPLPTPKLPQVRWTNDIDEGKRWISDIAERNFPRLSCDIETRGLAHDAPVVSFGLSASGDRAIAFGEQVCTDRDWFQNYLKPLLQLDNCTYIWHNGKFDVRNLRHKGINTRVDEDSMLLSYALDERSDEEQVHKLENLLKWEFGWPDYDPPNVRYFKVNSDKKDADGNYTVPVPSELYSYNALDCAGALQLLDVFTERAKEDNVYDLYKERLIPHSDDFIKMELNGFGYDINKAGDMLEDEVRPKLNSYREEMQVLLDDRNYNPNSSVQNARLVYDTWGVTHGIRRYGKERSVDKPIYLEIAAERFKIKDEDDIELKRRISTWAALLRDFKALDKQRGTYFEGLILRSLEGDGRIYTDLKLSGTVTGRPSSSRPNLLNITRPKAGLPNIRKLFVADKGCVIFNADYSQAELRTIAVLSGDNGLKRAYEQGLDIHAISAARFYGENFTYEQRSRAKNMNFGVPYGQSADTFQEKHDIPKAEAQKFIEWWKTEFSTVWEWRDEVNATLHSDGEVVTPFGRKRRFYLLTPQNQGAAHREAVNFLPQSISNDFTLSAIHILTSELDPRKATLNLTVYDSIVGNVREDHIKEVCTVVKQVMEAMPHQDLQWNFPFKADISIGPSWGDQKELVL